MKTNLKRVLFTTGMTAALFGTMVAPAMAAGNPSADIDCATTVTDSFLGTTGTRADLYGCKPIGNSGQEREYILFQLLPPL